MSLQHPEWLVPLQSYVTYRTLRSLSLMYEKYVQFAGQLGYFAADCFRGFSSKLSSSGSATI